MRVEVDPNSGVDYELLSIGSDRSSDSSQNPSRCVALVFCVRDIVASTAGFAGSYFLPPVVSNAISTGYWFGRGTYNLFYEKSNNASCLRPLARMIAGVGAGVFCWSGLQTVESRPMDDDINIKWRLVNTVVGITWITGTWLVKCNELGLPNFLVNAGKVWRPG